MGHMMAQQEQNQKQMQQLFEQAQGFRQEMDAKDEQIAAMTAASVHTPPGGVQPEGLQEKVNRLRAARKEQMAATVAAARDTRAQSPMPPAPAPAIPPEWTNTATAGGWTTVGRGRGGGTAGYTASGGFTLAKPSGQ